MQGGRAASLARARAAVARARAAVVAEPGGADALADALGDALGDGVAGVAGGGAEASGVVLGGGERNEARAEAREAPADGRV